MSVEERIDQLESRCQQLQKGARLQGLAIIIVGICVLILAVTG